MAIAFIAVVLANLVLSCGMVCMGQLHRRALSREAKLRGHVESLLRTIETYKQAVDLYKETIAKLTSPQPESEASDDE